MDEARVVRIGHVDSAGGIHRDPVGPVKLPNIAALCSVRDQIGTVQVIGPENLVGVREIERRVRGIVAGRARDNDPVGSVDLGSRTVDRLHRSVHRQRAAEGPREGRAAGHGAASAAAREPDASTPAGAIGSGRRSSRLPHPDPARLGTGRSDPHGRPGRAHPGHHKIPAR